jgi:hypothetical protein
VNKLSISTVLIKKGKIFWKIFWKIFQKIFRFKIFREIFITSLNWRTGRKIYTLIRSQKVRDSNIARETAYNELFAGFLSSSRQIHLSLIMSPDATQSMILIVSLQSR